MSYRIKEIALHDPNHPYDPKDGEQVIVHKIDPNTPEGFIVSSMLFGMQDDDGAIIDPALLEKLFETSRHTQHWNPVTKKPYIRERYKSEWVTYPGKVKRSKAFIKDGTPLPWTSRERNRQFLENERRAREEIYPKFVEAAARSWTDSNPDDSDPQLQTFRRARDLMLVVAEAAGVESEAIAMADLHKAVSLIRKTV